MLEKYIGAWKCNFPRPFLEIMATDPRTYQPFHQQTNQKTHMGVPKEVTLPIT